MANEKRVPLSEPIDAHGKQITEAVVREPTYADLMQFGEPSVVARNPDGTIYAVENDAAIRQYLDRCVVEPDPSLLRAVPLRDAIAIKAALIGFFTDARASK